MLLNRIFTTCLCLLLVSYPSYSQDRILIDLNNPELFIGTWDGTLVSKKNATKKPIELAIQKGSTTLEYIVTINHKETGGIERMVSAVDVSTLKVPYTTSIFDGNKCEGIISVALLDASHINGTFLANKVGCGTLELNATRISNRAPLSIKPQIFENANKLTAQIIKGTWEGIQIDKNLSTSVEVRQRLTLIFKNYDANANIAETVQVTKNLSTNIFDTLYPTIDVIISEDVMSIPYSEKVNDVDCPIDLKLKYSVKDGNNYLIGDNNNGSALCYKVSLSLKKISDATTLLASDGGRPKANEREQFPKLSPVASKLFKTVRNLSESGDGAIVYLTITNAQKNEIAKKSRLKISKDNQAFIENEDDEPFEASIEVTDLNGDGEFEFVLWKHDASGPMNSSEFTIYYKPKGGTMYTPVLTENGSPDLTENKVNGFVNIIIGGPGIMRPIYKWNGTKYQQAGQINTGVSLKKITSKAENDKKESGEKLLDGSSQMKHEAITKIATKPDFNVALIFIKSYADFIFSKSKSKPSLAKWIKTNTSLTPTFKAKHKALYDNADPEFGLEMDAVLAAQDAPERGFVILKTDPSQGYVSVGGIGWKEFAVIVKIIQLNGKWLVDGSGIVNIPKEKQLWN